MFEPHDPVDVEPFFRRFVQSYGGELIDTILEQPDFSNADFLFRQESVIAELKSIERDFSNDPSYQDKFKEKIDGWLREDEITSDQAAQPETLPEHKMRDLMQIAQAKFKPLLSKANRQIKETREHFDIPHASGLLLLANNGLFSLKSDTIIDLVSDRLNRHFSAIQGFVYVTLNRYSLRPGDTRPRLLWVPKYHQGAPDSLTSFVDQLGTDFGKFLINELGPVELIVKTSDRSTLDDLSYL